MGYQSFREVGCTHRRGTATGMARRFRAALLAERFSARVCLDQHHWLALRMRQEGITFRQCNDAFLQCSDPQRLQALADSLTAQDLLRCGQKWLAAFTPFFTSQERRQAGCQHRLFFSQVELCDNTIFFRRAAVDQFAERLLDMNEPSDSPRKKITLIFGRKVTRQYKGKLQTELEDLDLPNPVIRSHYAHGFAKQYVRDDRLLRPSRPPMTSPTMMSKRMSRTCPVTPAHVRDLDHYHDAQQDILETFIDRLYHRRSLPTGVGRSRTSSVPILPGIAAPRPLQTARQAPARQTATLSSLPS